MRLSKDDLRTILDRIDIARSVYKDGKNLPTGWKTVASSAPDPTKALGFFGRLYEKTEPLRPGESRYIFSFRGTHKASDMQDLASDFNILVHRMPKAYEQALAFVKQACKDNNLDPAEVEFAGHSSGGYLARTVAMTLGANIVWAFNSPGPSPATRAEIIRRAGGNHLPHDKLIQIRSVDDIVGKWGYDEGIILEVVTKGDHHAAANLRAGIVAVLEGTEPPELLSHKKVSWRTAYNKASEKIVRSAKWRKRIYDIFGHKQPPRSSVLRPALD